MTHHILRFVIAALHPRPEDRPTPETPLLRRKAPK